MGATKRAKENHLRVFWWFAVGAMFIQLAVGALVVYFFEKWDERSYFGEMFGVASCLFSGLALAGIILSLRFQSEELSTTREELSRQFRLSLLKNVLSEIDRHDVHLARNYVYRNAAKYAAVTDDPVTLQQLDEESYVKAGIVSNSFDRVGVLVVDDEESKELVLKSFGPSIARSWVALEPLIKVLRKGRYGAEYETFFQKLAEEAIERADRAKVDAMLRAWAVDSGGDPVARHEREVGQLAPLPLAERATYWERFYGSAESDFLFADREVGRFGVIAELIGRRPGAVRVLDVGCGAGGLSALLRPDDDYLGIDISSAAIGRAAAAHPGRSFQATSLEEVSLKAGSFDFVVLSEVLFYTDAVSALKRAAALLKPDTGRLVVSIYSSPSGDEIHRLLREQVDVLQEIRITSTVPGLVWTVILARPVIV